MDHVTLTPAATLPAGEAPETCIACACFDGDSNLSTPCETCGPCHDCLMCGRDHTAPKNGACPTPRIRVRKTGRLLWYAECPLTLTGGCNPRVGCEGAQSLADLHGWAMGHVRDHRVRAKDYLISTGATYLRVRVKERQLMDQQGYSDDDVMNDVSREKFPAFWVAQQGLDDAKAALAQLFMASGEFVYDGSARARASALVHAHVRFMDTLNLAEAA
jgi:hypothetical protein